MLLLPVYYNDIVSLRYMVSLIIRTCLLLIPKESNGFLVLTNLHILEYFLYENRDKFLRKIHFKCSEV